MQFLVASQTVDAMQVKAHVTGLTGGEVVERRQRGGAPIAVTLYWQLERYVDKDYSVFVHLARADGTPLAQSDGQYPSSMRVP